jgi:hypothetical protein
MDKEMKSKKTHRYYVMYGFNESDPDITGYLKLEKHQNGNVCGMYSVVADKSDATIFPAKNYSRKKGFGTPEQWAYFFAEEDELQDWNFHPVAYKK